MPRRSVSPPRLCKHPNGQACVYVGGRVSYLGKHGSAQATEKYRAFVIQWASGQTFSPTKREESPRADGVTVSMAVIKFWEWAENRYRGVDGASTRENDNLRCAVRPLRKLHGHVPLSELGPNRIREVQAQMIRDGLARRTINRRMGRVRQFIKWCVGRELCSPLVYEAIRHVEPIPKNQGVREAPRRRPVSWDAVHKTLPHLSPLMRAFVLVLWYTGARVGEIRTLTTSMIDRSGDVWRADLAKHKTAHHDRERIVLFGPDAIDALRPWLLPDSPHEAIFSPRRVNEAQTTEKRRRAPRAVYTRSAPMYAIRRACDRANPHPSLEGIWSKRLTDDQRRELREWRKAHRWTLASLRHSAATRIRERFGLDVAQVVLGHAKPTMTAHYSAAAIAHAVDAMRQAG